MTERLSGLDALRASLILLGLPFHAALPYAEGAMGLMQADHTSGAVATLVVVLRTFRMPTFFLVAGFFAALILARRTPDAWIAERARRLLIPLLAGVVTIVPLASLLVRHYRLETGRWIGEPLSSFYHLWFLVTLFGLCLATWALRPLLEPAAERLGRALSRLSPRAGEITFAGFVALAVLWEAGVSALFDRPALSALPLAGTLHVTMVYAPWYLFGWGLGRVPGGLAWFGRLGPSAVVAAAGLLALDLFVAKVPNFEAESFAHLAAWTAAGFYLGRLLVAAALRLPFAASPVIRRIVDHAMPIYVLHYPWAMVFALLLVPTGWAGGLQFLAVTTLTALATLATCAAVARVPLLAFLVNGRHPPRRAATTVATA